MFTDMVGYTALGQRNESLSLALLEEQRKVVRPVLSRHNGREVKTIGDAFLVEFESALDAVRCAYDVQRAVREFNISLPEGKRVHLRVGIHLGDVVESKGDISGDAVNVASRVEPLAEDGGVCLTRQVFDHVQGKFELPMTSVGPKSLKNVSAPVEVFKMVMPWEGEKAPEQSKLDRKRVAILPFTNISADPADEYFADGITEELISTVSNIAGLQVISRTSVMNFKKTAKPMAEIAKDLSAGSILEGSVRKAGDKVRVTAQLIDSVTDTHVWARNYDRQLQDIFAIQSDISMRIAESLKVELLEDERKRVQKEATKSAEAHLLYLKGRYFWNERTKEGLEKAVAYFEAAIKEDENYALAYSGLADSYAIMSDHGYMESRQALPLAVRNATKAVHLDGSLSESHASLGLAQSDCGDEDHGRAELKRAIEINPNNAYAHLWLALTGMTAEDEVVSAEAAARLDPLNLQIAASLGSSYYRARRFDDAVRQLTKVTEMNPNFPPAHVWLALSYWGKGRYDEAEREARITARLHPNGRWLLAACLARAGKEGEAGRIVEEMERSESYMDPADMAWAYSSLGDRGKVLSWLRRAVDERSAHLRYFASDPSTEESRSDPEVRAMLEAAGFRA